MRLPGRLPPPVEKVGLIAKLGNISDEALALLKQVGQLISSNSMPFSPVCRKTLLIGSPSAFWFNGAFSNEQCNGV
jgi:hypothetical protein